jgi:pyruvate, water dikinase
MRHGSAWRARLSALLLRLSGPGRAEPAELKQLFAQFKRVLESNQRALEAIADMGEKLGGDYLFDGVYLRRAYAALQAHLEQSLRAFDALTRGRYPTLREAAGRVDAVVSALVADAPEPAAPLVVFFEDVPWEAAHRVGGKAAQLAEVKNQLHLAIADGFAITTRAWDEFARLNGLEEWLARVPRDREPEAALLRELRQRIRCGAVPPALEAALGEALEKLRALRPGAALAVRSSAEEEDGRASFAGQFETALNVPAEREAVASAWRRVLASAWSERAVAYQRQVGVQPGSSRMAVACTHMVDAAASGVARSTDVDGDPDGLIISATWGLGEAVVGGRTEADLFVLKKSAGPRLERFTLGAKERMVVAVPGGGTEEVATPQELRTRPSLTEPQTMELARQAMAIERHFGTPRDVEWALDPEGRFAILQARPLEVRPSPPRRAPGAPADARTVLVRDRGLVVQRGAGAGSVVVVRKPSDLAAVPRGAVLVAANDSSSFVTCMPLLSAIVTETGSPTSHMATVCRELRVPTIVNLRRATQILKAGQEVTLVAEEGNRSTIYQGIARECLAPPDPAGPTMESVAEFRRRRSLLRYVAPLHLVDPLMDEFAPARCRSVHDVLRFVHEKAVAEMVERARATGARPGRRGPVVRLELPVPAGLLVMDLGGGLAAGRPVGTASLGQVACVPLRALLEGMTHPGAWRSEAVALSARDFFSSIWRMHDVALIGGAPPSYNVAVASEDYANLSIRFGYHFTMVDSYCSENPRNNHLHFRFAGGATDLTKRSRRLELIARVLGEHGLASRIKGDLLVAQVSGVSRPALCPVLDQTGRLIAYTRQLDALLHDERAVERYARAFLAGDYSLPQPDAKG